MLADAVDGLQHVGIDEPCKRAIDVGEFGAGAFSFKLFDSLDIDHDDFSAADIVIRNVQTGARVASGALELSVEQSRYDHPYLTVRGTLPLEASYLAAGSYQLIVSPAHLVDRAGNAAAKPLRFDLSIGGNTPPAQISTQGEYSSPRGCRGTFGSFATAEARSIQGSVTGVDCPMPFTGSVTLTKE